MISLLSISYIYTYIYTYCDLHLQMKLWTLKLNDLDGSLQLIPVFGELPTEFVITLLAVLV